MAKKKREKFFIKTSEILPRIMKEIGSTRPTDIAKYLDLTPQAIHNFQDKGGFPIEHVIRFSFKSGIGLGELIRPPVAPPPTTDDIKKEDIKPGELIEELQDPKQIDGLPSPLAEPPRIEDRRRCLRLRNMIEEIAKSESTLEAIPELISTGLPNLTPFIIRQRFLDTHSVYL